MFFDTPFQSGGRKKPDLVPKRQPNPLEQEATKLRGSVQTENDLTSQKASQSNPMNPYESL